MQPGTPRARVASLNLRRGGWIRYPLTMPSADARLVASRCPLTDASSDASSSARSLSVGVLVQLNLSILALSLTLLCSYALMLLCPHISTLSRLVSPLLAS